MGLLVLEVAVVWEKIVSRRFARSCCDSIENKMKDANESRAGNFVLQLFEIATQKEAPSVTARIRNRRPFP